MKIKNVSRHVVYKDPTHKHCCNQVNVRQLKNGEVLAIFNEERYPFHHDSGQTVIVRSKDGGKTWDPASRQVVLPYTDKTGNWDCGLCQLADGTLLVNLCMTGYFKKGIRADSVSWSAGPVTEEWGDWTWAYQLQSWLGTFVLKSTDNGRTWGEPIPVNVRPLKHGGTRLGCWQMPNGSILMGVYGRITGYGLGGEYETLRAALIRSDDNGENWEYYSTLAYDPASIFDYSEPALLRLADGRMVCMARTHVRPSRDAKNLSLMISEDDGFTWTLPKPTNIWGYPAELLSLRDGRVLMVYGYRRPPYGVRGCISEDGITWDVKNEFIISEGGVPKAVDEETSTTVPTHYPGPGLKMRGHINWNHPGLFQHIGYPSAVQLDDGTILCAYHEWSDEAQPIQYVLCTRFELAD
ncbi:MAG: sialidase family protein [Anaerolineae bacterium]